MPDSAPSSIPFTQDAVTSAATLLTERQRESFAQTAEVMDQHNELGATLAFDTTLQGLMGGSPGPTMVPAFYQDYAAADASVHLLDPDTAHTRLVAAFSVATDDSQRALAAASLMYVAVGRGIPDDSRPVVQWIIGHDDSASRLAYATALVSIVGDHDAARAQLERVVAEKPDTSTLSRAEAMLAMLDYVSQHYQAAITTAKSALALNVSGTRALAEAVEGNSTIGLAQSKNQTLAESELRASVRDNPYSFMTWYALARLDQSRNDMAAAAQDDRQALVSYELVASAGAGTYAYVVNPSNGQFYTFANDGNLDLLTAALARDVERLHPQAAP
jgi:tetratricopeptide (TPR) repeat protein